MTERRHSPLSVYQRHTQQIEKQIRALLGEPPAQLRAYRSSLGQELKASRASPMTLNTLKKRINAADVVLVGDFHTYRQSQRTFYRILRWLDPKKWTVALELVGSHQNRPLSQYLKSKMTESQFLAAIQYQALWGFQWENYAPIFRHLQKHRFDALGINRPELLISFSKNDLKNRDLWAAGCITDVLSKNRKVIALVGDWHVASQHLPRFIAEVASKSLNRKPTVLVIHQNPDSLYWRLGKKHPIHHDSIFDLGKQRVAVFSGTPWEKQQSLRAWIDEVELTHPLDSVESMKDDLDLICGVLKLSPPDLSDFQVDLGQHLQTSHLGELASLALVNRHRSFRTQSVQEQMTRKTLAFFMSLLAHPKRKTDLPLDWKIGNSTHERQALKLLGQIIRSGKLGGTGKFTPAHQKLAELIGFYLHHLFSENRVSSDWITTRLKKPNALDEIIAKTRTDLQRSFKQTKIDLL